jgi:methylated-DNA-[protein]-cysteine S-methyltransferase
MEANKSVCIKVYLNPKFFAEVCELAQKAGSPLASRAVGQAMARNPWLIVVPCHRVLAAGGAMGGFSAPGGITTKRQLLAAEQ